VSLDSVPNILNRLVVWHSRQNAGLWPANWPCPTLGL